MQTNQVGRKCKHGRTHAHAFLPSRARSALSRERGRAHGIHGHHGRRTRGQGSRGRRRCRARGRVEPTLLSGSAHGAPPRRRDAALRRPRRGAQRLGVRHQPGAPRPRATPGPGARSPARARDAAASPRRGGGGGRGATGAAAVAEPQREEGGVAEPRAPGGRVAPASSVAAPVEERGPAVDRQHHSIVAVRGAFPCGKRNKMDTILRKLERKYRKDDTKPGWLRS